MTAPTGAQLLNFVNQSFQQRGDGGNAFFKALTQAISDGWATWEKGLSFGGLMVTGVGAGAWTGSGVGGTMTGAPFQLPAFTFEKQDPHQVKLVAGLRSALPAPFQDWASTFKFTTLQFSGTSTATASNPGTVNANNVPTPLGTAGKGKSPSGIASAWEALLLPPDFDLTAPKGKTKELCSAISGSIEQAFDTIWLLGAQATANLLTGAAANGGVVSGLATVANGKVS